MPNFLPRASANPLRLLTCAALAATLAACGGGGGSPGANPNTPVVPPVTTPTTPAVPAEPKLTISLVDSANVAVTALSGGQTAQVRVKLVSDTGAVAVNEVIKFTVDGLVEFTPASGSALTDATGSAAITVKPISTASAGAATITATGVVGGKTATATVNLSVGAAPLTLGTLNFTPVPSGPLPAFSAIALQIPLTSGGLPATSANGLTLSSLCTVDGTATLVAGALSGGVQLATYTNKGCTRSTDVITVTVGNVSKTIELAVGAANIGTIQFVSSDLAGSSIVLKGSGGLGRRESALLTFRVLDQNNTGLAGVNVSFAPATNTGGLSLAPLTATSDANGNVTTTVSSGTIPTPVRVVASANRNGTSIQGLSDSLIISTGLPIQKAMSLSVDSYNIEGWSVDGTVANVTVRLADQYGNPISDDTAVNFVSEGGAIGSSAQGACTTVDGGCTVRLRSQNFRPTNGRVTILAYVQGIENFIDTNGDGMYSCADFTVVGASNGIYRPLVDTCNFGGESFTDQGDPFLDTGLEQIVRGVPANPGSLDGIYEPARGDLPFPYNRSVYSASGNGKWGINYIWRTAEVTFSGSIPTLIRQKCDEATGQCRDWVTSTDGEIGKIVGLHGASCSAQRLTFRLTDVNNNPMPNNTTLGSIDNEKVTAQTISPSTVGSTNAIGGTIHTVVIKPEEQSCAAGSFGIRVTAPLGTSYVFGFSSAPFPPAP